MRKKHAIIVSVFICIALIILVTGILLVGNQRNSFVKKASIKILFTDVYGLQAGNNVWYCGVKIGTVKNVTLQPGQQVEVTLNIDKHIQNLIHKDSKAKISSDGFIGNKIVVIYGGTDNSPAIANEDYLASEKAISTEEMLATLQVSNKNLLTITNNIKLVSNDLVNGKGTFGLLLHSQPMAAQLKQAVSSFRSAAARSNDLMQNLTVFSERLNEDSSSLNKLITDTTIYKTLTQTIDHIKATVSVANTFMNHLETAGEQLHSNDNTVGTLLSDEKTAEQVKRIIENLVSSSKKLDEDLEALQHNIFFRGFFRKKNKK
ncbi:MAG: MCE family protein [Bacteroidota bacterium]|nr:MCE family protein [Bacteroidota bacterium]